MATISHKARLKQSPTTRERLLSSILGFGCGISQTLQSCDILQPGQRLISKIAVASGGGDWSWFKSINIGNA